PVMVAKSGDRLLQDDTVAAISDRLVPPAQGIKPHLPGAAMLIGDTAPATLAAMQQTARDLHRLGARWVLLKGGHLTGADSTDLLFDGTTITALPAHRIATRNTHGTGCTLSAAIAALLPRFDMVEAVRRAKAYLTAALTARPRPRGGGRGPVHHFHALWTEDHPR